MELLTNGVMHKSLTCLPTGEICDFILNIDISLLTYSGISPTDHPSKARTVKPLKDCTALHTI